MVPAPSTSRRALLTGLGAGLATTLAGCSASESHQSPPDDGTLITDYVAAKTRSPADRPVVAPREDDAAAAESSTTTAPLSLHVVGSEDDAEALAFAADATNVAGVRRLVAETTYTNECVLLHQSRIRECYELKLNYITRDSDGDPSVECCSVIRDADVACERDAFDHVAVFIRLPFPADEFGGYSISSGGSCNPIPERYRNESESA